MSLRLFARCALVTSLVSCATPSSPAALPSSAARSVSAGRATRTLVITHLSDSEAALLGDDNDPDVGGLVRARRIVHALHAQAGASGIVLHAGDTFIPAPELDAQVDGVSAVVAGNNLLGLQASAIGNHEFDWGEGFLATQIAKSAFPYVSATVTVKGGPLLPLVVDVSGGTPYAEDVRGRLTPRAKVCAGTRAGAACDGVTVGVIGSTTHELRTLSAGVTDQIVLPKDARGIRDAVQAQVDALRAEGIDVVVLLSHLQSAAKDKALVDDGLVGVDVILSGGGENLLAPRNARLAQGDAPDPICLAWGDPCYGAVVTAADGAPVVLAATAGDFRYAAQMTLHLDDDGVIVDVAGGPVVVDDASLAALHADADRSGAQALVDNVRAQMEPFAKTFAYSRVTLNGERADVRNRETNLGDLVADAYAAAARNAFADVRGAFFNSGAVRASLGPRHGNTARTPLRVWDLKTALRFDSKVVVVDVTHAQLAATLEAALRQAGTARGHFPQVSRDVVLVYDARGADLVPVLDAGKTVGVKQDGARVRTLRVAGTSIVEKGVVQTPDARIRIATNDYLLKGGDGWFPRGALAWAPVTQDDSFTAVGEHAALIAFIAALDKSGGWRDGEAYVDDDLLLHAQRIRAVSVSTGIP